MTRFFALPVMATVLALVGVRMLALPAPVTPPSQAEPPVQENEATPSPIVTPQDLWVSTPATPPPPAPPAPAPRAEPVIIVLEPLPAPAAPAPQVEVVNAPVISPQTTVVNNYYPVVEVVTPPPAQEVADLPVAVGVGLPICAAHRRPGCCLQKPGVAPPQDTFFKKTPFLPPTPRRGRFEP